MPLGRFGNRQPECVFCSCDSGAGMFVHTQSGRHGSGGNKGGGGKSRNGSGDKDDKSKGRQNTVKHVVNASNPPKHGEKWRPPYTRQDGVPDARDKNSHGQW